MPKTKHIPGVPGIYITPQMARSVLTRYRGADVPLPRVGYEVVLQHGDGGVFIPKGSTRELKMTILLKNDAGEYRLMATDGPAGDGGMTFAEQAILSGADLPITRPVLNP